MTQKQPQIRRSCENLTLVVTIALDLTLDHFYHFFPRFLFIAIVK